MIIQLQLAVAFERDESAYRKLFLLFHRPLIRFAEKIVLSEMIAEEIYSDVMLKLWMLEEDLQVIENLKSYLFRMVKNAALNHINKNKGLNFVAIDQIWEDSESEPSPEVLFLHYELSDKISAAVDALPPQCQLVYRMIREENFTYKQVAEILDLSVNTIERHMSNALKKLVGSIRPYLVATD